MLRAPRYGTRASVYVPSSHSSRGPFYCFLYFFPVLGKEEWRCCVPGIFDCFVVVNFLVCFETKKYEVFRGVSGEPRFLLSREFK